MFVLQRLDTVGSEGWGYHSQFLPVTNHDRSLQFRLTKVFDFLCYSDSQFTFFGFLAFLRNSLWTLDL